MGYLNLESSLKCGVDWLLRASQIKAEKGFSGYYSLIRGWGDAYPETTGYIIPTLLNLLNYSSFKKDDILSTCFHSGEWLLSLQATEGFFCGYKTNKPFVFDTGQIIFGLLALYRFRGEVKYLEAARRAGDWLTGVQNGDGSWDKYTFDNQSHSYDSRVSWSLLELYKITKNEIYKDYAEKNLAWVVSCQKENGWFRITYISSDRNEESFLHLIAYVLQGLIESSFILNKSVYLSSAQKTAQLFYTLYIQGKLRSYYDSSWNQTQGSFCLTGLSQISIIFKRLAVIAANNDYLKAARALDNFVISKQLHSKLFKAFEGGIPGSSPVWGRYMRFRLINWAIKFHIDSLLLDRQIEDGKRYIIYAG